MMREVSCHFDIRYLLRGQPLDALDDASSIYCRGTLNRDDDDGDDDDDGNE